MWTWDEKITLDLLKGFIDGNLASDHAKLAVTACIRTGIITGRSGGRLAPKEIVTRAEFTVIVRRLLQKSGLI